MLLQTYIVSFFGHRAVENFPYIEKQVEMLIREMLLQKDYVEFLVGNNGEFDQLVSSVIRRVKKQLRDDNCCHTLVLPYMTAAYRDNQDSFHTYYDAVQISEAAAASHFKAALQKRNREMVDSSDMVVFYLERASGGAYQTYQYVCKQNKSNIVLRIE